MTENEKEFVGFFHIPLLLRGKIVLPEGQPEEQKRLVRNWLSEVFMGFVNNLNNVDFEIDEELGTIEMIRPHEERVITEQKTRLIN
jgi:hypothetical protein